ncbi:MAG: cytochrome c, partial [Planctomycetaceae bacterium]|nr:cytochrome c [Planctomycetaceae bacterium]
MPNRLCFLVAAVLGLVATRTSSAESPTELAQKAKAILQAKCHSCHGEGGSSDGNINFMLDRNRLVKRRKIVPGKSVESVLFRQVKTGTMPKGDEPLSKDEIDTLKRWIDGGAADFNPPAAPRPFIDNESVLSAIQKDLQKQADNDPEKLPFLR